MKQNASFTPHVGKQGYMPHVDGLRAIAIIPVVVYHLFPQLCPGGFAGVDVFFVISGFLITSGIISDLQEGRYSIQDFYVRRIKRILPAYVAIIGFVLILTPFLFAVNEAKTIASSAIYSVFYSANIYFYTGMSYFDMGARSNPLLHLWSLGVEEQFYLVIPLCIWFLWKIRRRLFLFNLSLLLLVSFVWSVVSIHGGNSQFAFFMLPCRAWELLTGAVLSKLKPAMNPHNSISSWASGCGLFMILISYALLDDQTPFPGVAAMPTVFGTALLIYFGNLGFCTRLLTCSPMVFVGKVSYSLYLWHWPIFLMLAADHSWKRAMAGCGLTVIAAYSSWRFIEMPVRRYKFFGRRHAFLLLVISTLFLVAGSGAILCWQNQNGNVPKTWNGAKTWLWLDKMHDPHTSACSLEELNSDNSNFLIRIGDPGANPSFALWGDSHALALLPGVDYVAKEKRRSGYYINLKQNFTLNSNTGLSPFNPRKDREPVFEWLQARPDITNVILVNCWFLHLRNDEDIQEVISVCKRLDGMGKHCFLLQSIPRINDVGLRRLSWGIPVTTNMLRTDRQSYDDMVERIGEAKLMAEVSRLNIALPLPVNNAFYDGSYFLGALGQSFFADNNHPNALGAIRAMAYLAPLIWPEDDVGSPKIPPKNHF